MKTLWVSKTEFNARASEILQEIEVTGASFLVTERGRPVIEIRRYQDLKTSPLERLRGSVIDYIDPLEPVFDTKYDKGDNA